MKRITVLQEEWETKQDALERVMKEMDISPEDILEGRVKISIIKNNGKTHPMYYPKR